MSAYSTTHIHGDTVDDLMRRVLDAVFAEGRAISPSKGGAREMVGVLLELASPLARLSRSETRGRVFSCLGELLWYLAGSNDTAFITHYIPQYSEASENGVVHGGYGPRIFGPSPKDQVATIIQLLRERPDSRRAVLQLFDSSDLREPHLDIPCTCTLQFLAREERLHMMASMRSNDVYLGLPHDIFAFTMLQELVARTLKLELGFYKHSVGSLHLYDHNVDAARRFISEGWQSTEFKMPPMPLGDPWLAVEHLLRFESQLRSATALDGVHVPEELNEYWRDLSRLLVAYACFKLSRIHGAEAAAAKLRTVRAEFASDVYVLYVDELLNRLDEQRHA